MTNLEQKIPNKLLWKMYDAMATINPYETGQRVEAAAKIALELAEKAYNQGTIDGFYQAPEDFKSFISTYE